MLRADGHSAAARVAASRSRLGLCRDDLQRFFRLVHVAVGRGD